MIMRYTAMRPCEVRRVTAEDIQLFPTMLPARAKRQVRWIKVREKIKPYLTPEFIPIRFSEITFQKALERASKSAGFPGAVSPYVIRHSAATHMLSRSGDIRAVQEVLGHSRIEMTTRHAHSSSVAKERAVDSL